MTQQQRAATALYVLKVETAELGSCFGHKNTSTYLRRYDLTNNRMCQFIKVLVRSEVLQEKRAAARSLRAQTELKSSSKYSGHMLSMHNAIMDGRSSVDLHIICASRAYMYPGSRSRSCNKVIYANIVDGLEHEGRPMQGCLLF